MASRNYQTEHDTIMRYAQVAAELETVKYLERPLIKSPETAFDIVEPILRNADREHCLVIMLDTKHRVLNVRLISVGSHAITFMWAREIYRDALADNAAAIVVAHNHPSGDCKPSGEDIATTERLVKAGDFIGIELLDHLVIGVEGFFSMAHDGLI